MKYIDQVQRPIQHSQVPKRIISLVPSHTEFLVRLGLEEQLVGITKFCVKPAHLRSKKTIVGGTKNIRIEKIKSLKPDLIICNKEENTEELVTACEGIAPVYVSNIISLDSNLEFILAMGQLLNKVNLAQDLVESIGQKYKEFKAFMVDKKTQRVAYFIWRNPYMVAGATTFINELLRLNKFENVFAHLNRYPTIGLNELATLDLDLILLSSEPYPFTEQHKKEFENLTKAKVVLVDGEAFSWHGSYLIKAFDYFKSLH